MLCRRLGIVVCCLGVLVALPQGLVAADLAERDAASPAPVTAAPVAPVEVAIPAAAMPVSPPATPVERVAEAVAADEGNSVVTPTAEEATLEDAVPARPPHVPIVRTTIPTKGEIRALLADGHVLDAEDAYFCWAGGWQEEDPGLLREVERAVLRDEYRRGDPLALAAMVRLGDPQAVKVLGEQFGEHGMPTNYLDALRALAYSGQSGALPLLRRALASADDATVDAAMETISRVEDRRIALDLEKLFERSTLYRRVLLARTLAKMRSSGSLQQRYLSILHDESAEQRQEAVLILAATGYPLVADDLRQLLQNQDAALYPLALSGIPALAREERGAIVREALAHKQQLVVRAGMDNLDALSATSRVAELLRICTTLDYAPELRARAITRLAAETNTTEITRTVKMLAFADTESPDVQGAALQALANLELLDDAYIRFQVTRRLTHTSPAVATAARAALLTYAMQF